MHPDTGSGSRHSFSIKTIRQQIQLWALKITQRRQQQPWNGIAELVWHISFGEVVFFFSCLLYYSMFLFQEGTEHIWRDSRNEGWTEAQEKSKQWKSITFIYVYFSLLLRERERLEGTNAIWTCAWETIFFSRLRSFNCFLFARTKTKWERIDIIIFISCSGAKSNMFLVLFMNVNGCACFCCLISTSMRCNLTCKSKFIANYNFELPSLMWDGAISAQMKVVTRTFSCFSAW